MENLYLSGKVKAVGVSNYSLVPLHDLFAYARVIPAVNQIEYHPYYQRTQLLDTCLRNGIHVVAYSPFGSADAGSEGPLHNIAIKDLGSKHKKSEGQVILRWLVQQGIVTIPKSVRKERLIQNIDIFDFELDSVDMDELAKANKNKMFCNMKNYWNYSIHE